MTNHWFWGLLMIACLVWYSTVTIYVSIKGVSDIKQMLARLAAINEADKEEAEG
jgi:hypothetical protein